MVALLVVHYAKIMSRRRRRRRIFKMMMIKGAGVHTGARKQRDRTS
jgi:hypothetical protein